LRVVALLDDLRKQHEFDATVRDETFDLALLGLQGPASEGVLQPLIEGDLGSLAYYHAREDLLKLRTPKPVYLARTGYTGEDGFELMLDASVASEIWDRLVADERVQPAGLGARDTLRLEAGMALYGHELAEGVTPFEAGLGRSVRLDKGAFQGRDALVRLSARPPDRRLVGLGFEPGAVPRAGCQVNAAGAEVGEIASGTFSPTLRRPIATAYVASEVAPLGTTLEVAIRGADTPATVVSLPFVSHSTKRRSAHG
jgi:aminomethyltransferase